MSTIKFQFFLYDNEVQMHFILLEMQQKKYFGCVCQRECVKD